jgi:hypothetical protein
MHICHSIKFWNHFPLCSPGRIFLDNRLLKIKKKSNTEMIIINHVLIKKTKSI